MKYIIYTDAAASKPKEILGCSYLILTEATYIDSDSISIPGNTNPKQAETISIGLAAAYMVDNVELSKGDLVTFYVDSFSAIQFCEDALKSNKGIPCSEPKVVNSMKVLRQLKKKCEIEFEKVHGHKDRLNPNTIVDRLAKLAIRRV